MRLRCVVVLDHLFISPLLDRPRNSSWLSSCRRLLSLFLKNRWPLHFNVALVVYHPVSRCTIFMDDLTDSLLLPIVWVTSSMGSKIEFGPTSFVIFNFFVRRQHDRLIWTTFGILMLTVPRSLLDHRLLSGLNFHSYKVGCIILMPLRQSCKNLVFSNRRQWLPDRNPHLQILLRPGTNLISWITKIQTLLVRSHLWS